MVHDTLGRPYLHITSGALSRSPTHVAPVAAPGAAARS